MISAFSWQSVFKVVAGTGFVIFTLLHALDWPEGWLNQINSALGMTIPLLLILGADWGAWRWAWQRLPKLNQWIYPDLNGTWRGTLSSNWPVIDRMAKAAKGELPAFDPFGAEGLMDLQPVPMTLRIRAGWFKIHVRMETDTRYSNSRTVSVAPIRGQDGDPHALSYVFENSTPNPVATDSANHRGAAWLSIRMDTAAPTLEGVVWTERNWRKGLNTAGLLSVTRISSDPEATI